MKNVPILGKILRIMELLAKIAAKLRDIKTTLIKLQKKATGSTLAAIIAALIAVGYAISAVIAATVNPEPMAKTALFLSAISAIVAAIVAIKKVIEVVETNKISKEWKKRWKIWRKI